MKKRHLVLTVLVLALGAAVYFNWQLAPDVDTIGDNTTEQSTSEGEQKMLGEATYVDANQDESVEVGKKADNSYFETARLNRESTHKDAKKELDEIIENKDIDDKSKTEAINTAAKLAANLENEQKLENLIKAKGFNEVLAVIGDDQISIVVKSDGLTGNQAAIIKDVVVSQMGVSASSVKIIEAK